MAAVDFDYLSPMKTMSMKHAALFALLLLPLHVSACSSAEKLNSAQEDADDNAVAANPAGTMNRSAIDEGESEADLVRAVTIGEDGPSLDACGSNGRVTGLGYGKTLPLRAAPFQGSAMRDTLANGTGVYICTRSVDQRWLGVIVIPDAVPGPDNSAAPATDCGVSSPVDSRRPYDGPCRSGWVAAPSIRLVAG